MNTSKWDVALATCDELENLLKDAYPADNPALLRQIQNAALRLQGTGLSYVQIKASRLSRQATIYLSARRHTREPQGAEGVMHEMRYSLLGAIREELRTAQRLAGH